MARCAVYGDIIYIHIHIYIYIYILYNLYIYIYIYIYKVYSDGLHVNCIPHIYTFTCVHNINTDAMNAVQIAL